MATVLAMHNEHSISTDQMSEETEFQGTPLSFERLQDRVNLSVASEFIASQLEKPDVQDVWKRYFAVFADQKPGEDIARILRDQGASFTDDPEMLDFAVDYLSASVQALHDRPIEQQNAYNILNVLRAYQPEPESPVQKPLREHFRLVNIKDKSVELAHKAWHALDDDHHHGDEEMRDNLLWALRHDSGQERPRPVRAIWDFFRHTLSHLTQAAVKNPKKSLAWGTAVVAVCWHFMKKPLPLRFDPEELAPHNIDQEALLTDLDYQPDQIDLDDLDLDSIELPSHGEYGKTASDFFDGTAAEKLVQHGSKIKDDGQGAIEWWQGLREPIKNGFHSFSERFSFVVEDPAMKANEMLPPSAWQIRYEESVRWSADWAYFIDMAENIGFHVPILAFSFLAARASGKLLFDHESSEELDGIRNVFWRACYNGKAGLACAATGAATGMMMDNGQVFSPLTVIMGVTAYMAANTVQRKRRQNNPKAFAMDAATSSHLTDAFADCATPLPPEKGLHKKTKDRLTKPFAKVAMGTGVAMAITSAADFQWNGGFMTADALGMFTVAIPAILSNVPQDAILHVGFAGIGMAGGLTYYFAEKAVGAGVKATGLDKIVPANPFKKQPKDNNDDLQLPSPSKE